MFMYVFSIFLIVTSNIVYNICAKSTPGGINPFVSLFITYLTAALMVALAYPFYPSGKNLAQSFCDLNWTSITLGVSIVGLEFGYIMAYRAGWNISVGSLVANILLAIMLIPVGVFFFKEGFSANKIIGVVLCLAGLTMLGRR